MAVAHCRRRRRRHATRGGRLGCAPLCGAVVELEHRDRLAQPRGLLVERLRGGGRFLNERRVLLRHLVHLRDRARDLVDAAALLLRRGCDLAHDVGHALHRADHFRHRAPGFVDERRAGTDALDRRVDQRLDLLGGPRRALREAAHLARDHCEAAAFLAGPRGLDGGIQRKNVGLERDPFDDRDDVRDLCRTLVDLAHRADHLPDDDVALVRDFRRIRGQCARLARIVRVLFHGAGQLLHARRGFLQRRRLFLGARRQVDVAGRDLLGRRRDRFAAAPHRADGFDEPHLHLAEALQQLAHFIAARHDDAAPQIARGDRVEVRERVGERAADRAAQRQVRHQRGDEPGHERDDRHDPQRRVGRLGPLERGLPGSELEIAQRLARYREIVVAHLKLLRAVGDPVMLVRRHDAREAVALALQCLALRGDVLRELVLFAVARQREVFLPPRIGLRAHRAAAFDRRRRFRRTGQQRGAIERKAFARGVHLGEPQVDRARHLVREDLVVRVVRARHAEQPQHTDQAQQPGQKRDREADARADRQVFEHHHFSCLASSLTGHAHRPEAWTSLDAITTTIRTT
ncbi:hypothetical protein BUB20358_06066 [Burkholderia ubonensis]|nr:hypothetical protein BUB20358_06066 [Burkholderia ubonensis]